MTYGHNGPGSIPNLSAETLASDLGLKFTGIPFRGDTGLMPMLLKGDIDFGMLTVPTLQGGKGFRPLVTFAKDRDPAFPDTPAARELGVTSPVSPGYNGVFAPKGLPAPVRAALAKACAATVVSAPFTRMMGDLGIAVRHLDGSAFHDLTVEDYKTKGELIRRLGMGGAQ